MRYGLGQGIEVDFIGPAYELQRPGAQGFADSGLGAKWEFAQNVSNSAAIDFLYTAPTGALAFTAGTPTQTLNLDYGTSISSRFGVAATAGVLHMQDLVTLLPSVVVTDQYRTGEQLYAEAYGQEMLRPHGGSLFGLDGGVQYVLSPQVVMDLEAGRTVAGQARSHYYGFGLGHSFLMDVECARYRCSSSSARCADGCSSRRGSISVSP